MLTRDEKELLKALKEHMDDEQKKAVSEMSEAELKGFLKEARKEIEKEMNNRHVSNDGGFWEFVNQNGSGSFLGAALAYFIKKKPGCALVIVLILAGVIIYFVKHPV